MISGWTLLDFIILLECFLIVIYLSEYLHSEIWISSAVCFIFCYVLLACFHFANAGFKSRVKYFSVVDPVQMTYYISEILDAGQQGPLFMVNFRFLCLPYIYIHSSVSWYFIAFTGDCRKLSWRFFHKHLSYQVLEHGSWKAQYGNKEADQYGKS